jgi:hypothetical protein
MMRTRRASRKWPHSCKIKLTQIIRVGEEVVDRKANTSERYNGMRDMMG